MATIKEISDVARRDRSLSDEALAFSYAGAAQRLGLGERMVRKLVTEGQIRSVRVGRRVLIPRRSLEIYVEQLLEAAQ